MAKVVMYTRNNCVFCDRAKSLLEAKGASFEEHNLQDKPDQLKALMEKTGMRTVPQIFINDELIGGFDDLNALDKEGKLDDLLK